MENPLLKYLAFVRTVEKGSFTKAAEDIHYAQSSISKMIADLENEWGMILLERSKSGVCLTSAGEQLLPFLRKALEGYNELEGQICRMRGLEIGVVRIGTFSSVAINWLPNVFSKLQKDYPGIGYEMLLGDYNEVEHWIDGGRVDCGFLRLPTAYDFDTIPLMRDEYKVVLPVGHPLAEKETIPVNDLNDQPFLLLEHGGKTEVFDLLSAYRVTPDIRFTTWEDFAIMAMNGNRYSAGSDPEACSLPDRGALPDGAVLPFDRTCHEKPGASDAGGSEVCGIPAVSGNRGMSRSLPHRNFKCVNSGLYHRTSGDERPLMALKRPPVGNRWKSGSDSFIL